MDAIVYTSNTGTTEAYAKLLSDKTGLPAYALKDAAGHVAPGAKIIYMGWLMASSVKGYKKAAKTYQVSAVCGVGMAKTGTQIPEVRKANALPDAFPVFVLQGGFDMKKLRGIYKFMMGVVSKSMIKGLSEKADKTPEEADMLDMALHGGNRVSAENLAAVLTWYGKQ